MSVARCQTLTNCWLSNLCCVFLELPSGDLSAIFRRQAPFFSVRSATMFQRILTLLLLVALIGCVFLYATGKVRFAGADGDGPKPGLLKSESQLRNKLAELRIEQDKVVRRVKLLEEQKNESVQFLKDQGVKSSADLTDDKQIRYAVNNLKRTMADIESVSGIADEYQEGINSIEAMLKDVERNRITKEIALTDEKAMEIDKIIIDLDEKLGVNDVGNVLDDDRINEILNAELSK